MKNLQFKKHKKYNYHGFTLVELIVVITILVILGTIGFVSLQGYSLSARDSVRVENMSNLHKGLSLFQIKTGTYPSPEDSIVVTASGTPIGYQGSIKENTLSILKLSAGATKDPLDPNIYTTYSINANNTKMQLMNFLEDGSKITALNAPLPNTENISHSDMFLSTVSASMGSDYSKRTPTTKGDTLGILLSSGSLRPLQEDYVVNSFTGVDVMNTNSGHVAVFGNSVTDRVSGSGRILFTTFTTRQKNLSVLDSSLLGYWDMETITLDGKLKDLSMTKNNGICYDSGTTVSCGMKGFGPQIITGNGKSGNAMSFNGLNAYIQNIASPYDFENQTFTVDFMSQPDVNNSGVAFAEGAVGGGWAMWPGNGSDMSICSFIKNISNNQSRYCSSQGGIPNTWNHFTIVTTTSTSDTLYIRNSKIYINGVLMPGNVIQDGFSYNKSDTLFSIGGRDGGSLSLFTGLIDEVRIYNRALSDSEILSLYNATK